MEGTSLNITRGSKAICGGLAEVRGQWQSGHPEKSQEMVEISGQMGVPVILIDGKMIVGFNRGAIDEALSN